MERAYAPPYCSPGVYFLQDPRSKVYNFDPYLQKIMPVNEFDFESLSEYITSSRDTKLESLAREIGKKYVGSTSSMTSTLAHFHYLLSSWRPINPSVISKNFQVPWKTFTALQRAPQAVFLRWKDGVYAVDADKEFDKESVLTLLGKSMEKLLTLPPETFEKYRRTIEPKFSEVPEEEEASIAAAVKEEVSNTGTAKEEAGIAGTAKDEAGKPIDTYHYSTLGDFLMRSQLDAFDPRLPGTGMFDLKTRAVVSIRMDVENFHIGSGYQIKDRFGEWESFEREYFDMIRAAFLKYSLQVRMGRMDGIFVAFHNTERIFGFQYITLEEMDASIHQDWHSGIGDREFKLSIKLLNDVLNRATEKFPEQVRRAPSQGRTERLTYLPQSLRIHFETRETQTPLMYIFIEPVNEEKIAEIQENKRVDLSSFLRELGDRKDAYLASIDESDNPNSPAKLEEGEAFTEEAEETGEVSASAITPKTTPTEEGLGLSSETEVETPDTDVQTSDMDIEPSATTLELGLKPTNQIADVAEAADRTPTLLERIERSIDEEVDEAWLLEIAKQAEANAPPPDISSNLLAYTLKIKSFVNGRIVLRPDHLKPHDIWEVQYELEEVVGPRAWSTYKACQRRRENWLSVRRETEDVGGEGGKGGSGGAFKDAYIRTLREMSLKGRMYLREKEKVEGEPVVWKGKVEVKAEVKAE